MLLQARALLLQLNATLVAALRHLRVPVARVRLVAVLLLAAVPLLVVQLLPALLLLVLLLAVLLVAVPLHAVQRVAVPLPVARLLPDGRVLERGREGRSS